MSVLSYIHRTLAVCVLLVGASLAWGGCTETPTEIVSGMTTQIQVPKDLKAVGVVVHLGGQLVFCQSYDVSGGVATLPSTLGTVPQESRDAVPVEPVTVTVLGFRTDVGERFSADCVTQIPDASEDDVMVVRRRRLPYVPERIVYLPMPLKASCKNVACDDPETQVDESEKQTCIGGKCVDNLLGPEDVVDYREELVFGTGTTCFSPERCLPLDSVQPAVLTDPETCTFTHPVPPGEEPPEVQPGHVNVELVYNSFNTEILSLDDQEGFVLPDPDDPLTFRLAENLCETNYKEGKISAVRMAAGCPAKRPLQPICLEELRGIQEGRRAPSGEPRCTISRPLEPTESALYVLLDRSKSMGELFGPEGLQFAVETPLKNPVAARTRLAFSFLPAESSACTASPSPFASPMFGFDDVEAVRDPIAGAVGETGNVLDTDPPLHLDAAMEGAYEALSSLSPTVSSSFNRRALVVVGNRDLQQQCTDPSATSPADLAETALLQDDIHTYVAVLDAPADAEQLGGDPVPDATAIATAGGTEVFDGVQDPDQGSLAVQEVINDLGSCVYDVPDALEGTLSDDPGALSLSYADPLSFERRDIAHDGACTEGASVDGWSLVTDPDSGSPLIRVCGQPCARLRDTLDEAAAFFASVGEPAPQVPIVVTRPCEGPSM